ncbi:MAG: hypothetical protein QXU98_13255 [Candidatus Parvarchaeota archaeon]
MQIKLRIKEHFYKAESKISTIVYMVIGLFVAAILLPLAITPLETMNTNPMVNGSHVLFNPAVVTVVEVLLPVLAIIFLALYFMPKIRGGE